MEDKKKYEEAAREFFELLNLTTPLTKEQIDRMSELSEMFNQQETVLDD